MAPTGLSLLPPGNVSVSFVPRIQVAEPAVSDILSGADIKPEVIQKTDIFKKYNEDYEKKPEKAEQPQQSAEPEQPKAEKPEQPKAELKKKRIVKKK